MDIEKVKQGLRCCKVLFPAFKNCSECPYEKICYKEGRNGILLNNALSVIESQQAEIERLREIATRDCDICANKMLNDERRWIPVSERLPDEYTNVLVMSKRFEEPKIDQIWIIRGEKMWTLDNVTHWMPLPQPPKEGDGE